jgi:hypothetical protein
LLREPGERFGRHDGPGAICHVMEWPENFYRAIRVATRGYRQTGGVNGFLVAN